MSKEYTASSYRHRIYAGYVSDYTAHGQHFDEAGEIQQAETWYRRIGRFLPENRQINVLDVACGNGNFLYMLRQQGYTRIQGIDGSSEQVACAQRLNLPVTQADAFSFLAAHSQKFDLITGFDVLEHFTKDEALGFLELIKQALVPGGRAIIQTPNAHSIFGARLRYADFTHELSFTPTSLAHLLRISGFTDIQIHPCGPVPKGVVSLIRYGLWQVLTLLLKAYCLIETGTTSDGYGVFTQVMVATAKKPLSTSIR